MTTPSNRPIDFWHWFPWTRLFRAFRIACDPRKLTLAAIALVLLWGMERSLLLLPFAPSGTEAKDAVTLAAPPWNAVTPSLLLRWDAEQATLWDQPPTLTGGRLLSRLLMPLEPIWTAAGWPLHSRTSWNAVAWVWTRLLAGLILWSIFGGAIVRIAAVEFARDERIGILSALRFSVARFLSLFSAPLLPLAGVLVLWGLCALGGLVAWIPGVGNWIVALAWGLALLFALVIALVLIAVAVGWPLMISAVMTEGSDAFDGFSRSFSYLYGRPWYYTWCVLFAIFWGMVTIALVDTLAVGVVRLAARTVATGAGAGEIAELHAEVPRYFIPAQPAGTPVSPGASNVWPAEIVGIWLAGTALVAVGFAVSFFWSAATVIYFLLRRAEDATHMDEVFTDAADAEDELLPLAGIASTGQPVAVRPHEMELEPPPTPKRARAEFRSHGEPGAEAAGEMRPYSEPPYSEPQAGGEQSPPGTPGTR